MQLFCLKENDSNESRVALIPNDVKKLVSLGFEVLIEQSAGELSGFSDATYEAAGAKIGGDRTATLKNADMVLGVKPIKQEEVGLLKKDALVISFLDPFRQKDLVKQFATSGARCVSVDMIPRSTVAQKMDAVSSQASLAGYAVVIHAAEKLNRIFPMMMTPAGTLSAAKVLIIGVGVAGLQAIATAKRLGARVTAFDTRPVVEEQVKSLGAKFLKIDLGETGQTAQGYALELTPEQLELQKKGMSKACADADVVITTAKVFGRQAPRMITKEMVQGMKPGSLVLDMAVDTGGNVEGSDATQEVDCNGVRIIGCKDFSATIANHASQMFSSNMLAFIMHFWNKETKQLNLDGQDEISRGCLLTKGGEIIHPSIK